MEIDLYPSKPKRIGILFSGNSRRFSRRKKLVDFLVIGAQKAGTSALDAYLRLHTEICMPVVKEVHFFDKSNPLTAYPNTAAYHSYFALLDGHRLVGEATPIYAYSPVCIPRIHKYNPNIKLIMVLRNPIERAFSQWNMEKQRGNEKRHFLSALKDQGTSNSNSLYPGYIGRGLYAEQITRILNYFNRNQLLLLRHEDLVDAPDKAMTEVYDFLGIDHTPFLEAKSVHARDYERPISFEEFTYLRDVYQQDLQKLASILDQDFSDWLSKAPQS